MKIYTYHYVCNIHIFLCILNNFYLKNAKHFNFFLKMSYYILIKLVILTELVSYVTKNIYCHDKQ